MQQRWNYQRRGFPFGCGLAVLLVAAGAASQAPYESTSALRAADLLAPELREGPHHVVEEEVATDGLLRVYTLTTEFGRFEARGEDVLQTRIREIAALAILREASRSPAFQAASERAGPSPFVSGRGLGEGPLDLLPQPGAGGAPFAPGLAGPRDAGSGDFLGQIVEFHAGKRKLAHVLGVDPYCSNAVLQRALARYAWVVSAGGAPLPSPPASDSLAGDAAEGGGAASEGRLDAMLRDYSAEDLEKFNRIELAVMGVSEELREQFIEHPAYSPSHETVLVGALAALEGTDERAAFIEAAVEAGSEDQAQAYRRMAEMMQSYASRTGGLDRIVRVEGGVAARTEDGELIVPVRADHALWTQRVAAFAETIAREAARDPEVGKTRIVFSGSVSPTAREQIESLGMAVGEGTFELPAPESGEPDAGERP